MSRIRFITSMTTGGAPLHLLYENMLESLRRIELEHKIETLWNEGETCKRFGDTHYYNALANKTKNVVAVVENMADDDILFYTDVDVVFLKNFMPKLTTLIADGYDFVSMADMPDYPFAACFYAMTKRALPLIKMSEDDIRRYNVSGRLGDQEFLRDMVRQHLEIKTHSLSLSEFPGGRTWYDFGGSVRNPPAAQFYDPYLVHYNWLQTAEEKIEKQKECGHWFLQ